MYAWIECRGIFQSAFFCGGFERFISSLQNVFLISWNIGVFCPMVARRNCIVQSKAIYVAERRRFSYYFGPWWWQAGLNVHWAQKTKPIIFKEADEFTHLNAICTIASWLSTKPFSYINPDMIYWGFTVHNTLPTNRPTSSKGAPLTPKTLM